MKTKALLLLLAAFIITIGAFAQEDDDMYFNASDRAKLKTKAQNDQAAYEASVKKAKKMREEEPAAEDESVESLNPTDSYSARNVNPEYEARSTAKLSKEDDQDYFVNNYQYSTSSNLNNWNNNFNSWYGNSWYTPNYYNPYINSWNSPYYGYADPYYSPWYNPYWNNSGWSASFSYYWGNGIYGNYGYGWGGNYNYWNRPYCGYASSWGYGYGYGSNYGYGGGWYGYPGSVIIVNNGEGVYGPRYGKRGTRGSENIHNTGPNGNNRTPVSDAFGNNNRSQRPTSNGRVASTEKLNNNAVTPANNSRPSRTQNSEYYNRSWRRVTQEPSNASNSNSNSNSGNSSSGRTSNSNSNSNWSNSNSNSNNNNSYTPSRNSNSNSHSNSSFGNSNSGGGGRSGGFSGGNSGGGGRSRGGRGN